jgi:hypothetical protein
MNRETLYQLNADRLAAAARAAGRHSLDPFMRGHVLAANTSALASRSARLMASVDSLFSLMDFGKENGNVIKLLPDLDRHRYFAVLRKLTRKQVDFFTDDRDEGNVYLGSTVFRSEFEARDSDLVLTVVDKDSVQWDYLDRANLDAAAKEDLIKSAIADVRDQEQTAEMLWSAVGNSRLNWDLAVKATRLHQA